MVRRFRDAAKVSPLERALAEGSEAARRLPGETAAVGRIARASESPEGVRSYSVTIGGHSLRVEHGPDGVVVALPGGIRIQGSHRDAENFASILLGIGERSPTTP